MSLLLLWTFFKISQKEKGKLQNVCDKTSIETGSHTAAITNNKRHNELSGRSLLLELLVVFLSTACVVPFLSTVTVACLLSIVLVSVHHCFIVYLSLSVLSLLLLFVEFCLPVTRVTPIAVPRFTVHFVLHYCAVHSQSIVQYAAQSMRAAMHSAMYYCVGRVVSLRDCHFW